MFTVHGYIDGVSYAVTVGDPRADLGASVGVATGTASAMALLTRGDGESALLTPTGPEVRIDVSTPAGVLAALYTRTQVTSVEGDDVPEIMPPYEPGVVY